MWRIESYIGMFSWCEETLRAWLSKMREMKKWIFWSDCVNAHGRTCLNVYFLTLWLICILGMVLKNENLKGYN